MRMGLPHLTEEQINEKLQKQRQEDLRKKELYLTKESTQSIQEQVEKVEAVLKESHENKKLL
jgi:hypothetical protein